MSLLPILPLAGKVNLTADIDTGFEYYKYVEPKMKISGPMYVLDARLGLGSGIFRAQLDGYYGTHIGQNIYNGQLFNGQPSRVKSTAWYVGTNLKLGLSHFSDGRNLAFLYTGVGYRYLYNFTFDDPGLITSYARHQVYAYLPVGISVEIPASSSVSFTGLSEYRHLIYGQHKADLTRVRYEKDYKFRQRSGLGMRFAVGMKFAFKRASIKTGIYYDFWKIDDSDGVVVKNGSGVSSVFIEPRNYTHALGLTVGASF